MATNQPYTLQDLQDRINTLVSNDSDTPETTDDEWTVRLNLINQAIGKWESANVLWDELWASHTHGSVVAAGDQDYTLTVADLKFPGGFLKLTLDGEDDLIQIISPEEYQKYGGEQKVAYFTGNNIDGWVLNLGWDPVAGDGTVGATISFPYFKYATRFTSASATTDKVEMSDPNYIVYDVAAMKSLMESKNNQFSVYSTEALNCMDNMRVFNEMKAPYQDGQIEDVDAVNFGAVIGE